MNLPILKSHSKLRSTTGIFGGIGKDGLFDSVNLICNETCRTRKARSPVMLHNSVPDQIIPCGNRLFFRFGNLLKEITKNPNGAFALSDTEYALKSLEPAPDRKLILWNEKLYVLPDNIQVGKDIWLPFAHNNQISVAFPFVNPYTLFYYNEFFGGEVCESATKLKIGMKLRFSWIPDEEFTIKTVETKNYVTEDTIMEEGIRITLDKPVANYQNIPIGAKAEYTDPENRPILNSLMIGYNHTIVFLGNSIGIYNDGEDYSFSLNDYFKVGQQVKISGASINSNNITAKIINISANALHFDREFTSTTEIKNSIITIDPVIPDFSHFLITEDRLFGVDNSKGIFYISALENPFLFFDSPTSKEDAWLVRMNGTATGIALWKDSIICFTEDGGFRILGYHALNFGLRQLSLNGIKTGCSSSLVRVGDTLYYSSEKGIMKYSGGSDKKISESVLKITDVDSAVTDGNFVYMLSNNRIWVYDTETERWWSENADNITGLFKWNGQIYLNSPEAVYITESSLDTDVRWSFELPLLEYQNQKKVIPLYMVINHLENTNCEFTLYSKPFGAVTFKNCGSYKIQNEGFIKIPLLKSRCNGFKIKVEGKGAFYPDSWSVYYKNT